jgi:hypothetical protein
MAIVIQPTLTFAQDQNEYRRQDTGASNGGSSGSYNPKPGQVAQHVGPGGNPAVGPLVRSMIAYLNPEGDPKVTKEIARSAKITNIGRNGTSLPIFTQEKLDKKNGKKSYTFAANIPKDANPEETLRHLLDFVSQKGNVEAIQFTSLAIGSEEAKNKSQIDFGVEELNAMKKPSASAGTDAQQRSVVEAVRSMGKEAFISESTPHYSVRIEGQAEADVLTKALIKSRAVKEKFKELSARTGEVLKVGVSKINLGTEAALKRAKAHYFEARERGLSENLRRAKKGFDSFGYTVGARGQYLAGKTGHYLRNDLKSDIKSLPRIYRAASEKKKLYALGTVFGIIRGGMAFIVYLPHGSISTAIGIGTTMFMVSIGTFLMPVMEKIFGAFGEPRFWESFTKRKHLKGWERWKPMVALGHVLTVDYGLFLAGTLLLGAARFFSGIDPGVWDVGLKAFLAIGAAKAFTYFLSELPINMTKIYFLTLLNSRSIAEKDVIRIMKKTLGFTHFSYERAIREGGQSKRYLLFLEALSLNKDTFESKSSYQREKIVRDAYLSKAARDVEELREKLENVKKIFVSRETLALLPSVAFAANFALQLISINTSSASMADMVPTMQNMLIMTATWLLLMKNFYNRYKYKNQGSLAQESLSIFDKERLSRGFKFAVWQSGELLEKGAKALEALASGLRSANSRLQAYSRHPGRFTRSWFDKKINKAEQAARQTLERISENFINSGLHKEAVIVGTRGESILEERRRAESERLTSEGLAREILNTFRGSIGSCRGAFIQ